MSIPESDLTVDGPEYWKLVPFDLIENLKFRKHLLWQCATNKEVRATVTQACIEDPVFFMAAFCWIYEPRERRTKNGIVLPNVIPMIPWKHQIPRIRAIHNSLGVRDVGVEKSRGEGASWIGVLLAAHDFQFTPQSKVSLVSKDQDAADKRDDMDSLMEKIDWELQRLPLWMTGRRKGEVGTYPLGYRRTSTDHVIFNYVNKSAITAFAATGDVASGGRAKWILFDELAKFPPGKDKEAMASTQHVTESRFFPSTPKGSTGSYYELMHAPSNMLKVILAWEDNPTKNRGLYRFIDGVPKAEDPVNNPLPANYDPPTADIQLMFDDLRKRGFKLEGKLRSPWYDNECYRGEATPQNIAQELDRDYGGSAYRIFDEFFQDKAKETICEPIHRANIIFDIESLDPSMGHSVDIRHPRLERAGRGDLLLWCPISVEGKPPAGSYAIGCDVSNGMGGTFSSASTMCVFNTQTSEQVAEWSSRTTRPSDFADYAIALAKAFHGAFLSWEVNGPGSGFTAIVKRRKYANIYYRMSRDRNTARVKKSGGAKRAGWHTNEESKEMMFEDFIDAVKTKRIAIKSPKLLQECNNYIRRMGKIHHALTANADDDAGGMSHGDLVIAACVGYQAMLERPRISNGDLSLTAVHNAPLGSFARRNLEWDLAHAHDAEGWDSDPAERDSLEYLDF